MGEFFTFLACFLILLAVSRIPIFILYLIGTAFTGYLFTYKPVSIYMGSLAYSENNLKIKLPYFTLFVKKSFDAILIGSCSISETNLSKLQKKAIPLFGSLFPIFISSVLIYLAFHLNFHALYKFSSIIFSFYAVIHFVTNLNNLDAKLILPYATVFSDKFSMDSLKHSKEANEAIQAGRIAFINDNYKESSEILSKVLPKIKPHYDTFVILMGSYMQLLNFTEAEKVSSSLEVNFVLTKETYHSIGLIKSHLGKIREGLNYYNASLSLDENYIYSLMSKYYTYNLLEKYADAIEGFDKIIDLNHPVTSNTAYAYSNRGLAKLKTGLEKEGLKDIEIALEINSESGYAYKNLGIYYFDKQQFESALDSFEKSYELDPTVHAIEHHIIETRKKLGLFHE